MSNAAQGTENPLAVEQVLVDTVWRTPDSILIDRPDWAQLITPSRQSPTRNCVYRARLAGDEVESRVRETAERWDILGVRYRWLVGPGSAPDDLGDRLEALGLRQVTCGLGMVAPVEPFEVETPPGLVIEPLRRGDVEAFGHVTARAWQRGPDFARDTAADALAACDGRPSNAMFHVAKLDGEIVATSLLRILPQWGYFQGGSVLPAHRGRGIYRALIAARMAVLAARNIDRAVVWAGETTSGPTLRRLGFRTICRATFHEPVAPDAPSGTVRS